MAKDVKKTQKKNVIKEDTKKEAKKVLKNEEKVVKVEKVKNEKVATEKVSKAKKVIEQPIVSEEVKKETKEEKKVKVKKEKKNGNSVLTSTVKVMDDNRKAIIFCIVGFLLATLLFRFILWPERIATLADGTQPVANINGEAYTADKLYEEMKSYYSVNVFLNEIDDMLLTEMYPEDEDMKESIDSTAEYYYNYYNQYYGYTKEDFLTNNGFNKESDFLDTLRLDYRRNEYYEKYAQGLVKEEEINKYYKDEVYGDVDSKHILVKVAKDDKEGLTDADAKKLAKEIITKLNSGKTWDEVIKEYKDKIVTEELGYNAYNASFEAPYLEECKKLEVGKYSKTPVKTSYGYHVIFKIAQKETPKLEEVKDDIIETLADQLKEDDSNLYYKALIALREDAKLEFIDTKFADAYKAYINKYTKK